MLNSAALPSPAFCAGARAQALAGFHADLVSGAPPDVLQATLEQAMRLTPQGRGSVWEHCQTVRAWIERIIDPAQQEHPRLTALKKRLPEFDGPALAAELTPEVRDALLRYAAWHDCGKPFVLEFDDQGRAHFPDHSSRSAHVWAQAGGSATEQELMRLDMALHTMSASDAPAFAQHPLSRALLISAVASLQANAEDFGGWESSSYKAKLKHLGRRARALQACWSATHKEKAASLEMRPE